MVDGPHADIIQPCALRAPELGCLVSNLIFTFFGAILLMSIWLFVPKGGPTWSPEAFHLAHMPVVAGDEFDLSYIRQGKHFEQYFTPEGQSFAIKVGGIRDLERALSAYNVLDDVELPLFVEFLRPMLRAAELLEHEWIK
ncbi:hypothetical protein BJ912DRAFT_982009 [Pholiota molesta]|nr:hypothetical protein BJ912DRAFT_982009 [Pholiota molesta]